MYLRHYIICYQLDDKHKHRTHTLHFSDEDKYVDKVNFLIAKGVNVIWHNRVA